MVISFSEKQEKLDVCDIEFFQKIVRDSFKYKRKNIKNNLKDYDLDIILNVLSKYGYDLSVRAEELDVKVFVDIANNLFQH